MAEKQKVQHEFNKKQVFYNQYSTKSKAK